MRRSEEKEIRSSIYAVKKPTLALNSGPLQRFNAHVTITRPKRLRRYRRCLKSQRENEYKRRTSVTKPWACGN